MRKLNNSLIIDAKGVTPIPAPTNIESSYFDHSERIKFSAKSFSAYQSLDFRWKITLMAFSKWSVDKHRRIRWHCSFDIVEMLTKRSSLINRWTTCISRQIHIRNLLRHNYSHDEVVSTQSHGPTARMWHEINDSWGAEVIVKGWYSAELNYTLVRIETFIYRLLEYFSLYRIPQFFASNSEPLSRLILKSFWSNHSWSL